MGEDRVREAWQGLQEALDTYEENLRGEVEEALRERRIDILPALQVRMKQLRQLRSALRRAEKLLPS